MRAQFDDESLAEYLAFGYLSGEQTMFRGQPLGGALLRRYLIHIRAVPQLLRLVGQRRDQVRCE